MNMHNISYIYSWRKLLLPPKYREISHEPIYKTHTTIEAKRFRATTFAIAKFEERQLNGEQKTKVKYCHRNIGKITILKGNKKYFAF